jgi:hypothetical protein
MAVLGDDSIKQQLQSIQYVGIRVCCQGKPATLCLDDPKAETSFGYMVFDVEDVIYYGLWKNTSFIGKSVLAFSKTTGRLIKVITSEFYNVDVTIDYVEITNSYKMTCAGISYIGNLGNVNILEKVQQEKYSEFRDYIMEIISNNVIKFISYASRDISRPIFARIFENYDEPIKNALLCVGDIVENYQVLLTFVNDPEFIMRDQLIKEHTFSLLISYTRDLNKAEDKKRKLYEIVSVKEVEQSSKKRKVVVEEKQDVELSTSSASASSTTTQEEPITRVVVDEELAKPSKLDQLLSKQRALVLVKDQYAIIYEFLELLVHNSNIRKYQYDILWMRNCINFLRYFLSIGTSDPSRIHGSYHSMKPKDSSNPRTQIDKEKIYACIEKLYKSPKYDYRRIFPKLYTKEFQTKLDNAFKLYYGLPEDSAPGLATSSVPTLDKAKHIQDIIFMFYQVICINTYEQQITNVTRIIEEEKKLVKT